MNCAHVLGLIDAGPFADYPPAHRDAARRHAIGCPTCGPALLASETIDMGLAAMPQPAAPRDLAAGVMARIARMDERATESVSARDVARSASLRSYPAFAAVSAGTALAIGVLSSGGIDLQSFAFARTSMGLVMMPATIAGAMGLAGSLGLYALGLFLPLAVREDFRPEDDR